MPTFYEKLTASAPLKPFFERAYLAKKAVLGKLKATFPDPDTKAFMQHNRKKYRRRSAKNSEGVVLIGQYNWNPSIYNYSLVSNYIADRLNARIETFEFRESRDPMAEAIFASFGARQSLNWGDAEKFTEKAEKLTSDIFKQLKTKWDVLNIQFEGFPVGDLIYDTYLRYYIQATVDLKDTRLRELTVEAAKIFFAAREYFAKNKVVAVLPDHTVYTKCGIISRLALLQNTPVYLLPYHPSFYLLSLDPDLSAGMRNPTKRFPYYRYRELFEQLSEEEKTAGREKARKHLDERLSGKIDTGVLVGRSAYGAKSEERILADTPKPKILILLHDFCDSVHSFRRMLFPDFYDWANFLFAEASKTDFEWYAKPHPNSLTSEAKNVLNNDVIAELSRKYPKVKILDAGVSNRQLVDEGICTAFTVHGTAGHEFASMGVTVVNAGDNLHVAFDFNITPPTVEEYTKCIQNAGHLNHTVDRQQVEEFYYMHYFYFRDNNKADVNPIDEEWRGAKDFFKISAKPSALTYFIKTETPEKLRKLKEYLDRCFDKKKDHATVAGL